MPVRREDKGASAGGLTWGGASRSRELRPESDPLFLAPLLALFHPGCLVRERPESGGIGCCLRPPPRTPRHRGTLTVDQSRESRSSGADVCPRFSSRGARASRSWPPSALPASRPRFVSRRKAGAALTNRAKQRRVARLVNGEATAHSAGRWQLDRRLWERWATALRVYRARNPTTLAAAHRAPLFERSPRPPVLQYPRQAPSLPRLVSGNRFGGYFQARKGDSRLPALRSGTGRDPCP